MFCAPELVLCDTGCDVTRFHVLRTRTRFWWYRGCLLPFLFFALQDSFFAVPTTLGPIFMFCAPGHVFGGIEGVDSRFHVLRSQTRFPLYRGLQVPFSCFELPNSFSAVLRSSGPVFMFCAPGLVLCGIGCDVSRFHVLRTRTHFRWY
jgi:hypothetical protein